MKSERGSVGSSFTIMIVIGIAAVVMIFVPLLSTAGRLEDIDQSRLQTAVNNFAESCASSGEITEDALNELISTVNNVNKYEVEIEVWTPDKNHDKKTTQINSKSSDGQTYIITYSSDVFDKIYKDGRMKLTEGGKIYVYLYNTNVTKEQAFSGQSNADLSTHAASAVVTVRKTGN